MRPCTIVIPCYNESDRLDGNAFAAFAAAHPRIGFHFIDDGSTDATADLLGRLCGMDDDDGLSFHSLPQNRGKGEAVRAGMNGAIDAGVEVAGFFDADLATPLSEIPAFLAQLDARPDLAMVFGSRVNLLGRQVRRKLFRHYVGRVFATAAAYTLDLPIYDTQCGAKLFRTGPFVNRLFAEPFVSRWIFDVELLARLIRQRRDNTSLPRPIDIIYERPIMAWHDVHGSKLRPRDAVIVWRDLYRIHRKYLAS